MVWQFHFKVSSWCAENWSTSAKHKMRKFKHSFKCWHRFRQSFWRHMIKKYDDKLDKGLSTCRRECGIFFLKFLWIILVSICLWEKWKPNRSLTSKLKIIKKQKKLTLCMARWCIGLPPKEEKKIQRNIKPNPQTIKHKELKTQNAYYKKIQQAISTLVSQSSTWA